ncbi:MAG: hypothetical protein KBT04_02435, partial [Bacteroidales bacterium]|nr:hypothetical protein [Candidatus Colimorpha onthohippi]
MRYLLMLTILWTISLTLTAQTDYPFIQYNKNHLVYDTESPYMQHFAHKWQRVVENHQGSLNIVHIGSSHVQGGTFPNAVRCNLLTYLPDLVGDRGMIFPYSAARMCNNPHDYRVHCPEPVTLTRCVSANPAYNLGLCGIAVTAHDITTHIQIALQSHINYSTTQVIVIGYSQQNIVPLLSLAGRQIPPSYIDPDSRRYIYNLASTIDSIQIVIPCQQGEQFTLQGIYLSNHYPGISYHSIGVNGASLFDYLKCKQWVDDLPIAYILGSRIVRLRLRLLSGR